jgi:hypothetical protein
MKDSIAPALRLFSEDERRRIFYRDLDDKDFEVIESLLKRLLSHKVWQDPDPSLRDLRYDDAGRAKEMLTAAGLTPGWTLGT